MTQQFRNASLISLIVSVALPAAAGKRQPEAPENPLVISVRVQDYAGVTRGVLAKAQSEAIRIFRRTGIETSWIPAPFPAVRSRATRSARPNPRPPTSLSGFSPARWPRR